MSPRSPNIDGGWAWVILFCGSATLLLNGFMCYSLGVVTEALWETFHEDLSVTAAVGTLTISVQCCSGPLSSYLINRLGCRATAVVGGVVASIGMIGASLAANLMTVMATFGILTGIGYGLAYTPANVMVARYFHKWRPLASGVTMAGAGLGMFVGPPTVRFLIDVYGLRGMFLVQAGVVANLCVLGSLMRPLPPESVAKETSHTGGSALLPERVGSRTTISDCYRKMIPDKVCAPDVFRNVGFVLYLGSLIAWNIGESASLLHLPIYCVQQGSTRQQAAFLFTIMGTTNTLSRLFTGFAANEERISPLILYMGQMGIVCVWTALFPLYSHTYAGQLVFAAATGMYIGGANSLLIPIVVQLVGLENVSLAFGFVSFMNGIGYLTGPSVAGAIVDAGASYTISYLFAASMYLLSGLLTMMIPLGRRREDDHVVSEVHRDVTFPLDESLEKTACIVDDSEPTGDSETRKPHEWA